MILYSGAGNDPTGLLEPSAAVMLSLSLLAFWAKFLGSVPHPRHPIRMWHVGLDIHNPAVSLMQPYFIVIAREWILDSE